MCVCVGVVTRPGQVNKALLSVRVGPSPRPQEQPATAFTSHREGDVTGGRPKLGEGKVKEG